MELTGGVLELDAITVTPRPALPSPAYGTLSPSSVWTRGELQPLQPDGVADVLDLVPSVNTQTTPSDPGAAVSVRGLQDFGRVNVMIDGARQNFQKSGHGANGTFYFDTEMLRSVDVTRGRRSAVYGRARSAASSSFTTLDADDVLDAGETVGGFGQGDVRDERASRSWATARRRRGSSDSVRLVAAATWRDAGDYEAGGGETDQLGAGPSFRPRQGALPADRRPRDHVSALHYTCSFDNCYRHRLEQRVSDTYHARLPLDAGNRLGRPDAPTPTTPTTRVRPTRQQGDPDETLTSRHLRARPRTTPRRFDTGPVAMRSPTASTAITTRSTPTIRGSSDDLTPSGQRSSMAPSSGPGRDHRMAGGRSARSASTATGSTATASSTRARTSRRS